MERRGLLFKSWFSYPTGQSGADGSFVFRRDQCTIIDKDNCMVDYVILANATQLAIISIRQRGMYVLLGRRGGRKILVI